MAPYPRAELSSSSVSAQHRAFPALLVIIALLATPLASVARASDSGLTNCEGMCRPPHGHYAMTHRAANCTPTKDASRCYDKAAQALALSCALDCTMRPMPGGFGMIAPIAPTKASNIFFLQLPLQVRSRNPVAVRAVVMLARNRCHNLLLLPFAAQFFCKIRHVRRIWRKRVGVEPTILAAKDRINGFEGHEGHRTSFASASIIGTTTGGFNFSGR
jgi:hypothetical protein